MQRVDGYRQEERVSLGKRCEWCDVAVHDAIECDVRIGARESSCDHWPEAELLPLERIRQLEPHRKRTTSDKQQSSAKPNQGCANVGMEEPVDRPLLLEQEVQRLNVDEYVRRAEGEKADALWCKRMNCGTWAEVEWRDWQDRNGSIVQGCGRLRWHRMMIQT